MRILQIYELTPANAVDGVGVAILELSKALRRLGHEVTILTGVGGAAETSIDGIEIIKTELFGLMKRTWSSSSLKLSRQLAFPITVLNRELRGYDIYHGHIYTSGLIAAMLARKNSAVAVNTIHGSYYPVWKQISSFCHTFMLGERALAPFLASKCDLQIHTAGYFATQVVAWGALPSKIKTIYNGVDIERFKPAHSINEAPVIFTARRLVKKNGLEYLIRAMPLLGEKCRLQIAGEGPERPRLEQIAKKGNARVEFLGRIENSSMPAMLNQADIVVLPSLIEASSIFLLEAMACGRAVVATRAGEIPKLLDATRGVLVEAGSERALAEGITELLSDEGKRRKLGENARRYVVENHSWMKIAQCIESEYRRLLLR